MKRFEKNIKRMHHQFSGKRVEKVSTMVVLSLDMMACKHFLQCHLKKACSGVEGGSARAPCSSCLVKKETNQTTAVMILQSSIFCQTVTVFCSWRRDVQRLVSFLGRARRGVMLLVGWRTGLTNSPWATNSGPTAARRRDQSRDWRRRRRTSLARRTPPRAPPVVVRPSRTVRGIWERVECLWFTLAALPV